MTMQTGWYSDYEYYVVKPLHNNCRQNLIMWASNMHGGKWNISAGVFSCMATYNSIHFSKIWAEPTSTNKNPSFKVVPLALEALTEIEQAIKEKANGKKHYLYIDGLDERRLRVYTKVLERYNCGYKKSSTKSRASNLSQLYKRV